MDVPKMTSRHSSPAVRVRHDEASSSKSNSPAGSDSSNEKKGKKGKVFEPEQCVGDYIELKLVSPIGGPSLEFQLFKDLSKPFNCKSNETVIKEIKEHIRNAFKLGMGLNMVFENIAGTSLDRFDWSDFAKCKQVIDQLSKGITSMINLWKGATRPPSDSIFSTPYCRKEEIQQISSLAFSRAVVDATRLNLHYTAWSNEVYGETSFEQMQLLIESLHLNSNDVFVDLGSGVGHLCVYVAGASQVSKVVGIEIADYPSKLANNLGEVFKKIMGYYGKRYRPFELLNGDFLEEKFFDLITKEATVIFINNFAFRPPLNHKIVDKLLKKMQHGTRIVSTKSYAGIDCPLNKRRIETGDISGIMDVAELPTVQKPTSWTGNNVPFYLHTVNLKKLEQYYMNKNASANNSHQGSGPGSRASPDSDVENRRLAEANVDASIRRVINRGGAAAAQPQPHADADAAGADDDDSEGETLRRPPKASKAKRPPPPPSDDEDDREYTPKRAKPSSSGAGSSRASSDKRGASVKPPKAAKETKDHKRHRVHSDETRATLEALHEMTRKQAVAEKKPKIEHLTDTPLVHLPPGGVILDPRNPLDAHISKSATATRRPRRPRAASLSYASRPRPHPHAAKPRPLAAAGAVRKWDKATAPAWSGQEGRNWEHVYAPEWNFLEEEPNYECKTRAGQRAYERDLKMLAKMK